MRADGQFLQEIAAALTAQGVPTKAGNRQWAHQTVTQMLKRYSTMPKSRERQEIALTL